MLRLELRRMEVLHPGDPGRKAPLGCRPLRVLRPRFLIGYSIKPSNQLGLDTLPRHKPEIPLEPL